MFEKFDYDFMLKRMMLDIQENYPELDYREGSMIHNAIAASALELSMVFVTLDNLLDQSFISTADRSNLYRLSEQMGIDTSIYEATKGKFKCRFDKPVPINSVWRIGENRYTILKDLGQTGAFYDYEAESEVAGTKPNSITGTLTAVSEQSNIYTYSELISSTIQGRDEYTDDEIRRYYTAKINGNAVDGNKAQYEQWCQLFDGIGNFKIYPLWDGPNTIKISILNENNRLASSELVDSFQKYIDPGSTGMGDGKAPVGAKVTVVTATEHPIDIEAKIVTKGNEIQTADLNEAISFYFADRSFKSTYVSYSQIVALFLSQQDIENVTDVKINGGTTDIKMAENEVPSLGRTNFTRITE